MLPELFSCRIEREREEMRVTKTFLKSTLEWNNYKPLLLHWSRGDMFFYLPCTRLFLFLSLILRQQTTQFKKRVPFESVQVNNTTKHVIVTTKSI